MPLKIYTKTGGQLLVQGETWAEATDCCWWMFWRRSIGVVGLNGHDVYLKRGQVVAYEVITDAEWEAQKAEAERQAEEQAKKNPRPGERPRLVVPGRG